MFFSSSVRQFQRCFRVLVGLMQDTLDTDDVLFDFTGRPNHPVLSYLISKLGRYCVVRLTKELVVFRAYDNTSPTNPASTPEVIRLVRASNATT